MQLPGGNLTGLAPGNQPGEQKVPLYLGGSIPYSGSNLPLFRAKELEGRNDSAVNGLQMPPTKFAMPGTLGHSSLLTEKLANLVRNLMLNRSGLRHRGS